MSTTRASNSAGFGIGYKLASVLCMTAMAAFIKVLDGRIPPGEIVVFRSVGTMLTLLVLAATQKQIRETVRTSALQGHLIRGISGAGGVFFNFLALAYLPLTEAVTLTYAIPLLTLTLATVLRSEHVHASRWYGAIAGFAGVLIVLAPRLGHVPQGDQQAHELLGMVFGLCGACCSAFSTIHIRKMSSTEKPYAIVFYFTVVTGGVGLLASIGRWVNPTTEQLLVLVVGGLLGGVGQLLFVQSLKHAHASLVAPFEYTSLLWAMLFAYCMFGDAPTSLMLAGAGVIALSGLYTRWASR